MKISQRIDAVINSHRLTKQKVNYTFPVSLQLCMNMTQAGLTDKTVICLTWRAKNFDTILDLDGLVGETTGVM